MYTSRASTSARSADAVSNQTIGWPVAVQSLCSVLVPILQSPTREPLRRLTWIVIMIVIMMAMGIGLALALRVPLPPGVAADLVELTRTGNPGRRTSPAALPPCGGAGVVSGLRPAQTLALAVELAGHRGARVRDAERSGVVAVGAGMDDDRTAPPGVHVRLRPLGELVGDVCGHGVNRRRASYAAGIPSGSPRRWPGACHEGIPGNRPPVAGRVCQPLPCGVSSKT